MKIITLHPLVIVVEGFYASASEIRRTWGRENLWGQNLRRQAWYIWIILVKWCNAK
jgi:hypothetical protein